MQLTDSTVFATSGASLFVVLSFLVFAETACQAERESQPADTHDIADDTDPASTSTQLRLHDQARALDEWHLLPGTANSRLRSSLKNAQSTVESHLRKAESIRDQLTEDEIAWDV